MTCDARRSNLAHELTDKHMQDGSGGIGEGRRGGVEKCEVTEAYADDAVVPSEGEGEGEVQGSRENL